MQLRPLEIAPDEFHFTSPFERWIFNGAAKHPRSYHVHTDSPVLYAPSLQEVFKHLGFDHMPVFDRNAQMHYPKESPIPTYRLNYLKYGIEQNRKNHIILELGDIYYLVHLDLKRVQKDRWHIDQITIRNGKEKYFIPCDDPTYKFLGDDVIIAVANTIERINNGADYHTTQKSFQSSILAVLNKAHSVATDFRGEQDDQIAPSLTKRSAFTP